MVQTVYFGDPTDGKKVPSAPVRPARRVNVTSGVMVNINLGYGNCRVDDITSYVSGSQLGML